MRSRYVYLLALIFVLQCVTFTDRAWRDFTHPMPAWMTGVTRWYEQLPAVIQSATFAIACIAYDRRRNRQQLAMPAHKESSAENAPPTPLPGAKSLWRERVEVRVVLYVLAILQFVWVPITAFKTFQVTHAQLPARYPPRWRETFWSAFPIETLFSIVVGIAMIAYDRWRIRREARMNHGRCQVCGYDLRATPDRCPECGTAVEKSVVEKSSVHAGKPAAI